MCSVHLISATNFINIISGSNILILVGQVVVAVIVVLPCDSKKEGQLLTIN